MRLIDHGRRPTSLRWLPGKSLVVRIELRRVEARRKRIAGHVHAFILIRASLGILRLRPELGTIFLIPGSRVGIVVLVVKSMELIRLLIVIRLLIGIIHMARLLVPCLMTSRLLIL